MHVLPVLVVARNLQRLFDLGRRAAHHELARRDEDELHAEGVGVLDWRVVCGFEETMESFWFSRAFKKRRFADIRLTNDRNIPGTM